ncbi:MAG: agmatinase [Candidatus Odinarchaeia archaeon]
MSYKDLYCSKFRGFINSPSDYENADFVVLGCPFDFTSTYQTGARFGPEAIRRASINLELFNSKTETELDKIKLVDIGDLDVSYKSVDENIGRINRVVGEILSDDKIPILLGGEHTLTYGALKTLDETVLVCFDAHLDLRDEYLGSRLNHATVMRRVIENTNVKKIIFVGTRAVSKEEFDYLKNNRNLTVIYSDDLLENNKLFSDILREKLSDYENVYITVDMDVLDVSVAPSVGNPEPGGLDFILLNKLISSINNKIIGFDVVEIAPKYFNDITSINAAKIVLSIISKIEQDKNQKQ